MFKFSPRIDLRERQPFLLASFVYYFIQPIQISGDRKLCWLIDARLNESDRRSQLNCGRFSIFKSAVIASCVLWTSILLSAVPTSRCLFIFLFHNAKNNPLNLNWRHWIIKTNSFSLLCARPQHTMPYTAKRKNLLLSLGKMERIPTQCLTRAAISSAKSLQNQLETLQSWCQSTVIKDTGKEGDWLMIMNKL